MSLDPNKTYLVWTGTTFPNSTSAQFKAPAGSTIDWGDGTVETFDTASTTRNEHTYDDGKTEHTIAISGLTHISNDAFNRCSSLTSVTIPYSVKSIGDNAFRDCWSLTSITIGNSVTSIGSSAFFNCSSLTSVTIPYSVKSIGNSVFRECSSLTSVTIGNNVTSIGEWSFANCSSLTSVTIGNSVTSIGYGAFWACKNLTSVTIGDSVTRIDYSVFNNCTKLTQLILFPSSPPTLASDAIPSTIQSIYVQQSSKDAYQKETNWTKFASKIVGDNIYLSFTRFNIKNKEYIDKKNRGTDVIANPGTNVVANPGTGTTRITDIQISGTKYFILPAKYEEYLRNVTFAEPTVTVNVATVTSPVKDGKFLYNQTIIANISHIEVQNDATSLNNLTLYWRGSSIQSNIPPSINDTTTIISSGSYKLSTSNNKFQLKLPYVVDGESRSVSSYKDIPSGYALWYGAGDAATRLDTTNIKNIVSNGSVNISVETAANQKITIMFPGTVTAKTNASFSTNIPLTKTGTVSLPVYSGSSGTTILADAVTYNIYQTEPLKAGTNDITLTLGGN